MLRTNVQRKIAVRVAALRTIEMLEQRLLLTTCSVDPDIGLMTILGDSNSNNILVEYSSGP
jgi:hypothetical protein